MPRILSEQDIVAFRESLIDAAERLFAAHGPDAVTIRELAAAVGVSPMTPYRYFKDKDAILAAARARAFDRHADALEAAYAAAGPDLATRRAALGEAYIRFAEEHPAAYRLMFDVNQPHAADHPDLVRAGARSRRTMTLGLDESAGEGGEHLGHLYWAALHGPLMLQLCGLLPSGVTARNLAWPLVAALDRTTAG